MTSLSWQRIGTGHRDLVLIHGWGLNSRIWSCLIPHLAPHFRLHLVDLPGYGHSQGYGALSLEQMAEEVCLQAPSGALWLGWSLGGLVATTAAYQQQYIISGLITVASSPCFCSDGDWPGIPSRVLEDFANRLRSDFNQTIRQFLSLQTIRTKSARQDMNCLKNAIMASSMPKIDILSWGLELLRTSDLRLTINKLNIPLLRLYGYLDSLVPHKVIPLVNAFSPKSKSIVFFDAAHALFISHPTMFCQVICDFNQTIS